LWGHLAPVCTQCGVPAGMPILCWRTPNLPSTWHITCHFRRYSPWHF
jgi:hypothetical protein